jgi:tellurite resistance protein TehA-like permease
MAQDPGAPPTVAQGGGVGQAVRTLNPGYFALTMATGIVSIAMENQHAQVLSVALLWLAAVAYAVLLTLYVWRVVAFRADVVRDLADPARAFGYFTFVAATDVLGTRLAIDEHHGAALVLLAVGSLAWLVLGYVIPWTAVLGNSGRPLAQHANGTWFIWVVASQWTPRACVAGCVLMVGRGVPLRCGRGVRRHAHAALPAATGRPHPSVLGVHGRHRDHGGRSG